MAQRLIDPSMLREMLSRHEFAQTLKTRLIQAGMPAKDAMIDAGPITVQFVAELIGMAGSPKRVVVVSAATSDFVVGRDIGPLIEKITVDMVSAWRLESFGISRRLLEILYHTEYRAAGGFYCGGGSDTEELVSLGLMEYAGKKSFVPDPYYRITSKGRRVLKEQWKP